MIWKKDCVTVQGLTGLKKTDGVNWKTVKAIGFLYPNILDTLSYTPLGVRPCAQLRAYNPAGGNPVK